MTTSLLRNLIFVAALSACSSSRNASKSPEAGPVNEETVQPEIAQDKQTQNLMDLSQTQYGGFVLKPGLYEAEFKTYCLQPGTPDPRQGDAYLQGSITG